MGLFYRAFFLFFLTFFWVTHIALAQNKNIDSLQALIKTDIADTNKVNHLNKLCSEFIDIANFDAAMNAANAALQLSQELNYKKGIANSYNSIGVIYDDQDNYAEALKNYNISLMLREEMIDLKGIAGSYNNIGVVYRLQGNYPAALKNYYKALKIKEKMKDSLGLANSHNNIGSVYYKQGNYLEALKNYTVAFNIYSKIRNIKGLSNSYNNIGIVYYDQQNYSEALINFKEELKLAEEMNDKSNLANANTNIGNVFDDQGNYKEALKYYFISLKIDKEVEDNGNLITDYINVGGTELELKNYKKAKEYLDTALQLAQQIENTDAIKDCYSVLTKLAYAQNNWKDSYLNYKQYILYKDSLDNEEIRKKTVQTAMTYEFEKKEAATKAEQDIKDAVTKEDSRKQKRITGLIAVVLFLVLLFAVFMYNRYLLIRKQSKIIEEQRKKIEAQQEQEKIVLEQKLLRSQMNPHFIFNTLNSIRNFVLKNDSNNADKYLIDFSKLMRLILESSRKEFIPLLDEIQMLEYYLKLEQLRNNMKFDYSITIQERVKEESYDIKISPMLLQPFVENAILHGLGTLTKKGMIRLEFVMEKDKEELIISIEDNGIGRQKAMEIKNAEKESHESLATKITEERIAGFEKKYKKNITATIIDLYDENNLSSGTKAIIHFPIIDV